MLAASTVMVVASMGLSGCGSDNPAPKAFTPPKAPSVSGSSSADAVPQMPDEAKQNNAASAKAFVRYYFEVLNHATHTGDVADLDRLSAPGCLTCNNTIELTTTTYEAGGRFQGKGITPGSMRQVDQPDGVRIRGKLHFARETTVESAGATPQVADPLVRDFEIRMDYLAAGWEVQAWSLLG